MQYDDTPLVEVVQIQTAGYTSQFNIFNQDGIYIAKAKGSRLFLTEAGSKSNLKLRHLDKMTICELDGRTLFEIQRREAAALKTDAELFTQDGRFIQYNKFTPIPVLSQNRYLQIGGILMMRNRVSNSRIGILLKKDGGMAMGAH